MLREFVGWIFTEYCQFRSLQQLFVALLKSVRVAVPTSLWMRSCIGLMRAKDCHGVR